MSSRALIGVQGCPSMYRGLAHQIFYMVVKHIENAMVYGARECEDGQMVMRRAESRKSLLAPLVQKLTAAAVSSIIMLHLPTPALHVLENPYNSMIREKIS